MCTIEEDGTWLMFLIQSLLLGENTVSSGLFLCFMHINVQLKLLQVQLNQGELAFTLVKV